MQSIPNTPVSTPIPAPLSPKPTAPSQVSEPVKTTESSVAPSESPQKTKTPTTMAELFKSATPSVISERAQDMPQPARVVQDKRVELLKDFDEKFSFKMIDYDASKLKATSILNKLIGFSRNSIQFEQSSTSGKIGLSPKVKCMNLILMKFNPRSDSASKIEANRFLAYAHKEYCSENTEYILESRDLNKIINRHGLDSPEATKQMKFLHLHYVSSNEVGNKQINISSACRFQSERAYQNLLQAEQKHLANPSEETENALKNCRTELLTSLSSASDKVIGVLNTDTFTRYRAQRKSFGDDLQSTKQGRIWREFRAANKRFIDSPQATMDATKKFFQSWGKFNKAILNVFFFNTMPENNDEVNTIQDSRKAMAHFQNWENGVNRKTPADYGLH